MILARWKKMVCAVAVLLAMLAVFNLPAIFAHGEQNDQPILTVTGEGLPEKLLTGAQITLPTATAVKGDNVTPLDVTVRVSHENLDITHAEKTYTLDKKGIYNIYFETVDPLNGLYDFKSYNIDVRDVWISIKLDAANPATAFVGLPITLVSASVFGLDDARVDVPVAISIKQGSVTTPLNGLTFTPLEAGKYTIIYTAEKSGESVTLESNITITGTRPTLTVRNIPAFVTVGDKVMLPQAEAFNLDGSVVSAVTVTVSVTKDNVAVAVTDYVFTAAKAGTYIVVYTAVNSDGIPTVYTATITCKKAGCGKALIISSITVGSVVVIGGVAVLLFFMIKRKRKKPLQEGTTENQDTNEQADTTKQVDAAQQEKTEQSVAQQAETILGEKNDEDKK